MRTLLISMLFLFLFLQNVLSEENQEIQNLRTFTKLYGYVRYFHPSDESASLDWDRFALYGVEQVKKAKNNDELKSTLEQLFYPIAPTMQIYKEGQKPEPLKFPSNIIGLKIIAWQHYGYSSKTPGLKSANNMYRSIRTNRINDTLNTENSGANIFQMIDATTLKGKNILFKADMNLSENDTNTAAYLWITNYNMKDRTSYISNMIMDTIKLTGWKKHELHIKINDSASSIAFGCSFEGNGKLFADNFEIVVQDGAGEESFIIENPGFEDLKENGEPKIWYAYGTQYTIKSTDDKSFSGKYSLLIEPKKYILSGQIFEQLPKIGEVINKPIGCGLYCQIPLALYSDDKSTLGIRNDYSIDSLISKISTLGISNDFGFGTATNGIDGEKYRGKEIKLKASVKTKVEGEGNQAQLWLRVDKVSGGYGFFNNMDDRPIKSSEWKEYEIVGKVDDDAARIVFGGMLIGEGNVWLDDFQLYFKNDKGDWEPIEIPNYGFENGEIGSTPDEWRTNSPGYIYKLTDEIHYKGNKSLMLEFKKTISSDITVERLADVIITWNVFQHFFPYMDVVNVNWDAELTNTLKETISDSTDLDFYYTLSKMTSKLQDGHINVNSKISRTLSSIPFQTAWVENQIVVIASDDTSKFKAGDIILSIDDKSAFEELSDKEQFISGSTQFKRWKCLGWGYFGKGLTGSIAKVKFKRGNNIKEINVERNFTMFHDENKRGSIEEIEKNIYYVNINTVITDDFNLKVPDFALAKGIIFDFRGYPYNVLTEIIAHLIDKEVSSANWLIPEIIYPDREKINWHKTNWQVYPIQPKFKGKIIFLTDGRAISAAETFMGIIEHYKLGEIIGQPTAGTNGNITNFMLPDGISVIFTGMKVLKHDGSQHHLIGIKPTIPIHRTIKGIQEGRDEYLEKALEILGVGLNIDSTPQIYK